MNTALTILNVGLLVYLIALTHFWRASRSDAPRSPPAPPERVNGWYFVELFGRDTANGYLDEVTVAGASFLRVRTPANDGGFAPGKILLHPKSIFRLTEASETEIRGGSDDDDDDGWAEGRADEDDDDE